MAPEGGSDASVCSSDGNRHAEPAKVGGSRETLVIWSLETLPARVAIGSGGFFVSAR